MTWTSLVSEYSDVFTVETYGLAAAAVPEPFTWVMAAAGVALLSLVSRRRRR
jgi:hypothetical protein